MKGGDTPHPLEETPDTPDEPDDSTPVMFCKGLGWVGVGCVGFIHVFDSLNKTVICACFLPR